MSGGPFRQTVGALQTGFPLSSRCTRVYQGIRLTCDPRSREHMSYRHTPGHRKQPFGAVLSTQTPPTPTTIPSGSCACFLQPRLLLPSTDHRSNPPSCCRSLRTAPSSMKPSLIASARDAQPFPNSSCFEFSLT